MKTLLMAFVLLSGGVLRQPLAAETRRALTFEQYLKESAVAQETIARFLKGPSWARFDPELGYVLGNYLPQDGLDHSATLSTVQTNGARTSLVYSGRPCRINTYGDSFTQCHQVSDSETWQEYLAGHLGEPIRNFGMGGYGVYQAYRRMVREEKTDHGAPYVILYIWGDDHIRSLFLKEYFIGHYNPRGNHFFAYSIKDKVMEWLDPKPVTYQQQDPQTIDFNGYLEGYK